MKPQVLVGAAIAVVLAAFFYFSPALRSSASRTSEEAMRAAEHARRAIYHYDPSLPPMAGLTDLERLAAANLQELHEAAQADFEALGPQFARYVQDLKATLRKAGGDADTDVRPLGTDAGAVQSGVSALQARLQENEKRLEEALAKAKSAMQSDPSAPGVAQVAGIGEYLRALRAYESANLARGRLAARMDDLIRTLAEWKSVRSDFDRFDSVSYEQALAQLQADLERLEKDAAEARQNAEDLKAQLGERESELAQVNQQLEKARADILALESQGFDPANESSFRSYRDRYLGLSDSLAQLQAREQELRFGGLRGAEIIGDDLESGRIEGGEELTGIQELRRRIAAAEERASRLSAGNERVAGQIDAVRQSEQMAQGEADRYRRQLDELKGQLSQIATDLGQLATDAFNEEAKAIAAAQAAASAFRRSQQAIDEAKRAAADLAREKDPNNQNPRLREIARDEFAQVVGASAEAAAQFLVGRVQALRLRSTTRLIDVLELLTTATGGSMELATYREVAAAAKDGALTALNNAQSLYERLAQRGPTVAQWIPLSSLATVEYLLAEVDAEQADQHFSNAVASISDAVLGREKSPYLESALEFRDFLKARRPEAFEQRGATPAGDEGGFSPDEG